MLANCAIALARAVGFGLQSTSGTSVSIRAILADGSKADRHDARFGQAVCGKSKRGFGGGEAMRASISLGRIAGIKVGINASVFLILAILVGGLATGQLPAAFPGRGIAAYAISDHCSTAVHGIVVGSRAGALAGGAPQRHRGREHCALAPWWRGTAAG